jgi:hypothetical protein
MDRTTLIIKYLTQWQDEVYEKIESTSDIRVFNAIGLLVTLVNGNLMSMTKAHSFLTETLSLDTSEKEEATRVYLTCHDLAMKERYGKGKNNPQGDVDNEETSN